MAGKSKFTAADYTAQRVALEEQIRVAEDDHHRAGYRQVLDEATQDDVDKALVSLDALKNRRRSLDAAWQESQRRSADALLKEREADQSAALAEFEGHLKTRLDATARIEEAARALGAAVKDYSAASEAARYIAGRLYKNHTGRAGIDTLNFVQSEIDSPYFVNLLAGMLFAEGANFSNTRPGQAHFEYRQQGSLIPVVEKSNDRLRFRAAELCPDIGGEEEAAA
ncbi:hypothetical protein KRZ98_00450 [Sphingobium sp. AS12]|uniref:hypothetical protein n=1 Tax=Sphingobium sp. AS12 TaxID=2849495 RepID=UPI001C3172C6|nr:hypothetical protein [Sphingobium sp. AS12]MBV2146762.1 hypothetical protein [Sphingobium sp. AS12]